MIFFFFMKTPLRFAGSEQDIKICSGTSLHLIVTTGLGTIDSNCLYRGYSNCIDSWVRLMPTGVTERVQSSQSVSMGFPTHFGMFVTRLLAAFGFLLRMKEWYHKGDEICTRSREYSLLARVK